MRLILFLLLPLIAFGYRAGDSIDDGIQKQLQLEKNKIYIVDFFASWCDSCKKEIPLVSKLNKMIDVQKVEIIGIDVDEDVKKADAFQKELKNAGTLSFKVINDPKGNIIKHFDPIAMPAIFIIQDHKIKTILIGAKNDIDKVILDAISL